MPFVLSICTGDHGHQISTTHRLSRTAALYIQLNALFLISYDQVPFYDALVELSLQGRR
jgi:hypothetical protein